ncbi:unnamed protein product [Parajaminaea phylloscopi]
MGGPNVTMARIRSARAKREREVLQANEWQAVSGNKKRCTEQSSQAAHDTEDVGQRPRLGENEGFPESIGSSVSGPGPRASLPSRRSSCPRDVLTAAARASDRTGLRERLLARTQWVEEPGASPYLPATPPRAAPSSSRHRLMAKMVTPAPPTERSDKGRVRDIGQSAPRLDLATMERPCVSADEPIRGSPVPGREKVAGPAANPHQEREQRPDRRGVVEPPGSPPLDSDYLAKDGLFASSIKGLFTAKASAAGTAFMPSSANS